MQQFFVRVNRNKTRTSRAVTVDIITILPTFLTFIIPMIGDSYPLPPSQIDFVKALQAPNLSESPIKEQCFQPAQKDNALVHHSCGLMPT